MDFTESDRKQAVLVVRKALSDAGFPLSVLPGLTAERRALRDELAMQIPFAPPNNWLSVAEALMGAYVVDPYTTPTPTSPETWRRSAEWWAEAEMRYRYMRADIALRVREER